MSLWLDLKGPINADTAYADGKLVAKDATIALPAITPLTTEHKAMGTMTLPIIGQIESMELSITKVGIDIGLLKLLKVGSITIEFRWAQEVIQSDGTSKVEGCKAFLRCVSKGIPGLGIEPGNPSENELAYEVTRYQLFVGGKEMWLIDRLNSIFRIDGKDYYSQIKSLL